MPNKYSRINFDDAKTPQTAAMPTTVQSPIREEIFLPSICSSSARAEFKKGFAETTRLRDQIEAQKTEIASLKKELRSVRASRRRQGYVVSTNKALKTVNGKLRAENKSLRAENERLTTVKDAIVAAAPLLGLRLPQEGQDNLLLPISELVLWDGKLASDGRKPTLPKRVRTTLGRLGIEYVYELVELTEYEVLETRGAGPGVLAAIKAGLAEMGLSLGTKLPGDFPRKR
jgi:cell division protein FtsB